MSRVLVAVGEVDVRRDIAVFLESHRYAVAAASTLDETIEQMRAAVPDIVIVDYRLPTPGALPLLTMLRKTDERVTIIALVGPSGDDGVRAISEGADHQLLQPVALQALLIIVQRVFEVQRTRRRLVANDVTEHRRGLDPFAGRSAAIRAFSEQAHRVLDSDAPVLIQGETGTGKGVLASWLHHHGPRAEEPLVDINCAGLSREFVESELFGHERGAFTGASAAKLGLLDLAHRGTAFLDEIGEIDLQLQPRLLKVLEEKRFRRLGDVRDHVVDIRLIAATNRDLARRARDGTFRADLYYRINTISLTVPSLRERVEDIPALARQIANGLGHDIDLTPEALRAMQAYDWPGNVRELRNVIERAILISARGGRITPSELVFAAQEPPQEPVYERREVELGTLVEAERRHIERVLRFESGSIERAAARLGVSRSTLYQKLRRHGMTAKRG